MIIHDIEGSYSAGFGFFSMLGVPRMATLVPFTALLRPLTFDYAAAWEGVSADGIVPPWAFKLTIQPSGGGATLLATNIVAGPLATSRTDPTPARGNAVDLTQFVGQDVRISFDAELPGYGSGLFQLDNVALHERREVPVITVPVELKVHEGQQALLSVSAAGPESLNYQWQKNGADIP